MAIWRTPTWQGFKGSNLSRYSDMSYLVSSVDKYFLLREFLSLPGHCWEAVGLGRWNQAPSSCWATRVRCNLCVSLFSKVGQKESEKQLWKWGLMTLQVTLIKELWTSLTLFSLSFLVLWINCTRFSRWNTSPEVKQKPSDKCKSASGEKLSPGPPAWTLSAPVRAELHFYSLWEDYFLCAGSW